ncbi:MAG: flagellar hook-associated protein FlgK, partial [Alphaproteobacteria bacterium]|nr:flagellar hook-associated protein FlgK [Alphaproteobacteria bacterium]
MVGLSAALNNALSGLNVNQNALSVLSQNIANANTAGYSKQNVNQQSVYLDGNGLGVSIDAVTRKVDQYLIGAVQRQNSVAGQTNIVSDYNDRIQLLIGKPGSNTNISYYTDAYFGAVQSLSQTPDNPTLQQNVIESSKTLAGSFSDLARELNNLQLQADKDIELAVNNINVDLLGLKDINASITNARALGKSTADLEDRRDQLVKDISQYIDINTTLRDSGAMTIKTAAGITILDTNLYKLSYSAQNTVDSFSGNASLSSLIAHRLTDAGEETGIPLSIIVGGKQDEVASTITSGKIKGLIQIRDQQIPALLNQLDTLASELRDQVNAIHNVGSGFPPANSYTGTRLVTPQNMNEWSGKVRIAVLDATGHPLSTPYSTQSGGGLSPLTIDLSTLNSGEGEGKPSVQTIINEINQYYGIPQNKVQLGNLDNIRLASNSKSLPGSASSFNFDFDLSNRSGTDANIYITSISVQDDTSSDVAGVTSTIPSVALDPTTTYVTTTNSTTVVVHSTTAHGFIEGQRVYLSTPSTDVDGIPAANLGGFFTISNVTSSSFEITVSSAATAGLTNSVANVTAKPPYSSVNAGEDKRTSADGTFTANLIGSTNSEYYTVTASITVDDGSGELATSQISYRVINKRNNLLNERVEAISANNNATIVQPTSATAIATAMLVDADGNELFKSNGAYSANQSGYLSIRSNITGQTIVIDSLDSKEIGPYSAETTTAGSTRSFSHYFELNNFFKSNAPIATGDTLKNSALNMQLEDRIESSPHLISTGKLTRVSQSESDSPLYLYERNPGDSSIIGNLLSLGTASIHFDAATGLATTDQSFSGYAGSILGVTAQQAANADTTRKTSQTLLDGFA